MINFAKYHVEKALEAAAEKSKIKKEEIDVCYDHTPYYGVCVSCGYMEMPKRIVSTIDKNSILNAYSIKNIK